MGKVIGAQAEFNHKAAMRDWSEAVALAEETGRTDLVAKHSFDPRASRWTEIDAHTKALLADLRDAAQTEEADV